MENINVHILEASGRLSGYSQKIKDKAEEAIVEVVKKIPVSNVDIVFRDNPDEIIPHLGMGGYCPNENIIFVSLDPSFKEFNETINKETFRTLAHELHHTLRWRDPGYGNTLLETMVSEGLADHFDIEVTGGELQKWDTALNKNQLNVLGKLAEDEYNKDYDHQCWFFVGGKDRNIPKWAAYTLGFNLVGDYLRKTNKKASELFNLEAKEFIK